MTTDSKGFTTGGTNCFVAYQDGIGRPADPDGHPTRICGRMPRIAIVDTSMNCTPILCAVTQTAVGAILYPVNMSSAQRRAFGTLLERLGRSMVETGYFRSGATSAPAEPPVSEEHTTTKSRSPDAFCAAVFYQGQQTVAGYVESVKVAGIAMLRVSAPDGTVLKYMRRELVIMITPCTEEEAAKANADNAAERARIDDTCRKYRTSAPELRSATRRKGRDHGDRQRTTRSDDMGWQPERVGVVGVHAAPAAQYRLEFAR